MSFSEALKYKVKQRADFTCCWCNSHANKVQIHHIIPQKEGGPDTEDNAALCGACHDLFGGNPDLRKEIRQRRDALYRKCMIEAVKKDEEYSFQRTVTDDPKAALDLLRIHLEYFIFALADASYTTLQNKTLDKAVYELREKGSLTLRERDLLSKMIDLLVSNTRSTSVDEQAVDWAMKAGPKLLKILDEKLIVPYEPNL